MSKQNNEKDRNVKINEDVKKFANATLKHYKKKNGDYFDSKKELRSSYAMYLLDLFPYAIEFCVKYGHIKSDEVQEIKTLCYQKFTNPDFVKILEKELKNDNKIQNIKLYPIVIDEIIREAKKVNDAALAQNPNAEIYDVKPLIDISTTILKKKMKKLEKEGIDKSLAFDVLSVIPCGKALENGQLYRVHEVYNRLYERSKGIVVPFEKIMDIAVGTDYYPLFITFALLERKEKFSKYTDNQRKLYIEISQWCFNMMEKKLSKDEVESIIKTYVTSRKKDDGQGKDGNRRYSLMTLSADDYPKIQKIIQKMVADDDSIKKYL
jgi:hypothetical protein